MFMPKKQQFMCNNLKSNNNLKTIVCLINSLCLLLGFGQ